MKIYINEIIITLLNEYIYNFEHLKKLLIITKKYFRFCTIYKVSNKVQII